jgi:DNA-binding NtrC family response regulator
MRIVIADDDPQALEAVRALLADRHQVFPYPSGGPAIASLERERADLVVTDLMMPEVDGFAVLRAANDIEPPVPAIVVTALDTARSALEALKLGAADYLMKPVEARELEAAIDRLSPLAPPETGGTYGLVGGSQAMVRVRRLIPLLARSRESVLLTGETGTGKELLAHALHAHGPRAGGPFVAHNMAATPSELAESVFFGHVRGAFSGATSDHAGLFEQAHLGTLFLDEVDSFPLPLQAKLLRVLESGRVQRVGSATERTLDVRVIAASSVDLGRMVAHDRFRGDLYYRLRQLEAALPPLRDRFEDIPALIARFLAEIEIDSGIRARLAPASLEVLMRHRWPGNCRELRSAIRSASLMAAGGTIQPAHLPAAISGRAADAPAESRPGTLREIEREHILRTLERCSGNQSRAALALGIDRGTLARKLREFAKETQKR